jgi:hypothetical protein
MNLDSNSENDSLFQLGNNNKIECDNKKLDEYLK